MKNKPEKPAGSKSAPKGAPKTEPEKPTPTPVSAVAVRRITDINRWIVPTTKLDDSSDLFPAGLLINATFNPTAPVMKDVFCGTDNVSESEVVGELEKYADTPRMPEDATYECEVMFDRSKKIFRDVRDRDAQVVTSADYVVLSTDGTARAGWRKNPFVPE